MTTKVSLTIGEKIDRAKDGRSQKWIVNKMVEAGLEISEVQFSIKKKGNSFDKDEIKVLSEILSTDLTK